MRYLGKQSQKESKYILKHEQVEQMMKLISHKIEQEKHFKYTVYTIYYESVSDDLIVKSCHRKGSKKCMRLRSYGIPKYNDPVYIETKDSGQLWYVKNRYEMTLDEAHTLLHDEIACGQVEIDEWVCNAGCIPKFFVGYERVAYCCKLDPTVRITFTMNVRYRNNDFRLCDLVQNKQLFNENTTMLEIKGDRIPPWLMEALSECGCIRIPHQKIIQLFHYLERHLKLLQCTNY